MSTRIIELIHNESGESYLYLQDDKGKLWSYTSNIKWERSENYMFQSIDGLLELTQKDPELFVITEYSLKGQWTNRD